MIQQNNDSYNVDANQIYNGVINYISQTRRIHIFL
jgi:hypothetical protein